MLSPRPPSRAGVSPAFLTHTVHEPVPPGVELAADAPTLRRAAGAPALRGARSWSRGGHSVCSFFQLPLTSRPLICMPERAPAGHAPSGARALTLRRRGILLLRLMVLRWRGEATRSRIITEERQTEPGRPWRKLHSLMGRLTRSDFSLSYIDSHSVTISPQPGLFQGESHPPRHLSHLPSCRGSSSLPSAFPRI